MAGLIPRVASAILLGATAAECHDSTKAIAQGIAQLDSSKSHGYKPKPRAALFLELTNASEALTAATAHLSATSSAPVSQLGARARDAAAAVATLVSAALATRKSAQLLKPAATIVKACEAVIASPWDPPKGLFLVKTVAVSYPELIANIKCVTPKGTAKAAKVAEVTKAMGDTFNSLMAKTALGLKNVEIAKQVVAFATDLKKNTQELETALAEGSALVPFDLAATVVAAVRLIAVNMTELIKAAAQSVSKPKGQVKDLGKSAAQVTDSILALVAAYSPLNPTGQYLNFPNNTAPPTAANSVAPPDFESLSSPPAPQPVQTEPTAATAAAQPPTTIVDQTSRTHLRHTLNFEIPHSELKFGETIGRGSYGDVRAGFWRGTEVAIKATFVGNDVEKVAFMKEAELMCGLRPHKNVVQVLGICVNQDTVYLVMDRMVDSLSSLIYGSQAKELLTPVAQRKYALNVAAGLQHLAAERIVHRDIASRNVLIDSSGAARISDFGMSRQLSATEAYGKTQANIMPIRWSSPENLRDKIYNEKSDVWAYGCFLFELTAFTYPYSEVPDLLDVGLKVRDQGAHPRAPPGCDPLLAKLMSLCFQQNPDDRPGFAELCSFLIDAL